MNVFLQPPSLSLGLCEGLEQHLLEWMKALEKLRSRLGLRDPSCLPPLASFTPHAPIMGDRLGSILFLPLGDSTTSLEKGEILVVSCVA